ncbi:Apoptosis-associated speck-like protein containing a CARD [Merluccius polli]|uniref:Apoptosis-associated speck-like protein containing a CARD n=1 Tax=Merluccius polli TaxID=89951 RepID=A0AA47M0W9_MERPO|nr:Apoptosis-associated speck-like protein containing a CARD [Merluccius polli]
MVIKLNTAYDIANEELPFTTCKSQITLMKENGLNVNLTYANEPVSKEHFVDRHCSSLVQRISLMEPILDQLLDQKVVSQEQYDTILTKEPQQNQVQELYSGALRSSGTRGKDIFLSVLEKIDHLLIEDLRGQCRPVPPLFGHLI